MRHTLLALAFVQGAYAAAAGVTIKLATLAPEGSVWDLSLRKTGEKWKETTEGQVTLRIYPGGVAGNEGDMIRKCRIGELQAAAVTGVGLHDIVADPQAVMVPGMIDSYEELDYVMDRMSPMFEIVLYKKGFQVIQWSEAGWVHFFSQVPVHTPADERRQKLFFWSGDPGAEKAMRRIGFNPVVVSSTDMIPSLETHMITAFNAPPLIALSTGWYRYAKNMTQAKWGVIIGATVVNRSTWERIPADKREAVLRIARDAGRALALEVRKIDAEAVETMKKNGLNFVEQSATELADWQKTAEATWPQVRGTSVPAGTFDEVKRLRDEFRAAHPTP
jgi:TRAP-type transport system periplasmic protein